MCENLALVSLGLIEISFGNRKSGTLNDHSIPPKLSQETLTYLSGKHLPLISQILNEFQARRLRKTSGKFLSLPPSDVMFICSYICHANKKHFFFKNIYATEWKITMYICKSRKRIIHSAECVLSFFDVYDANFGDSPLCSRFLKFQGLLNNIRTGSSGTFEQTSSELNSLLCKFAPQQWNMIWRN